LRLAAIKGTPGGFWYFLWFYPVRCRTRFAGIEFQFHNTSDHPFFKLIKMFWFTGKTLYELAEALLNESYCYYSEGQLDQFEMIKKLDECIFLLRESRTCLQKDDKISFEGKIQFAAEQLLAQIIHFKDMLLDIWSRILKQFSMFPEWK